MPQKTAQEIYEEEQRKRQLPTAQEIYAQQVTQVPSTVGGLDVNTSPVQLPPPREVSVISPGSYLGDTVTGEFPTVMRGPSLQDQALAAAGIDVTNELRDFDLRGKLGFSPSPAFTADFLRNSLMEKYNLPEDAVKLLPNGMVVFLDPNTRRFTPIDSSVVTSSDLADMYGPTHAIAPAITGAMVGGLGGPWLSVGVGAGGAFVGELLRLGRGRLMGVHDLEVDDIIMHAASLAGIDLAAGAGGEALLGLKRVGRKLLTQQSMDPNDARRMTTNMANNQELVDEINQILRNAGSNKEFRLTVPHQSEDEFGIALVDAVSGTSNRQRAARAAETKAEESALNTAARGVLGIDETAEIVYREEGVARPAQNALRAERRRLQERVDQSLVDAEDLAMEFLEHYGKLDRQRAGGHINALLNTHVDVLTTRKDDAWEAYQLAIGQPVFGTKGYTASKALTSNISVPVTQAYVDAQASQLKARAQSALAKKALGPSALKKLKVGDRIDLAVLDEDIKTLRKIVRDGKGDIDTFKTARDLEVLKQLRYDYLAKYHPKTLALLDQAETATTLQREFVKDSIFATILKQDPTNGEFILNNVATFRAVWSDTSGAAMKELVDVANNYVGGRAALREAGFKLYRANVTPPGSNIVSKKMHDAFVHKYEDVLKELYNDPSFYKFGKFAENVERTGRIAARIRRTLARSPLGRLGSAAPEKMGAVALGDNISVSNIRSTMRVLNLEGGPQAVASFRESVGREVWRTITTDNKLSTTQIKNLLETKKEKLALIYGEDFVPNLMKIHQALHLARRTISGVVEPKQTFIGRLARVFVSPPLTPRGRAQSLVETARSEAGIRLMSEALRDPRILARIVRLSEKDLRHREVMALLTQTGTTALVVDERIMED